jgi:serine protease Do
VRDDEFTDAFAGEFKKANYPIVGDPNALFDDPSDWKAEILVAGLIKSVKANLCYSADFQTASGEAAIDVEWQIFSRLERKIVHKVQTTGTASSPSSIPQGASTIVLEAFAQATQALLADEEFHKLISRQSLTEGVRPVSETPISIKRIPPYSGTFSSRVPQLQSSVVTVLAGAGHGSGFFISTDGLILTNSHVVEGAKFVKLKITTGREILGEVIRANRVRDIALIRTQESGFQALPIAWTEPQIGTEVLAVGSPFTEKLSATVTKGILSGYRTENGMKFIQSDVTVQPGSSGGPLLDHSGNAIGITTKALRVSGTNTGQNFFIPILDALATLQIEGKQ